MKAMTEKLLRGGEESVTDAEPLTPEEILAHVDLKDEGTQRGNGPVRGSGLPLGGGILAWPKLYSLEPDELTALLLRRTRDGHVRYVGMFLTAVLDPLPRGHRYRAASLTVELDGTASAFSLRADQEGIEFVDLSGEVDPMPAPSGLRALTTRWPGRTRLLGRPRTIQESKPEIPADPADLRTSGIFSDRFSWTFDTTGRGVLAEGQLAMHAVVEIPADAQTVSGWLTVQASVQRSFGAYSPRLPAATRERTSFTQPAPGYGRSSGGMQSVRLFITADVEKYSTNDLPRGTRAQERLAEVMERARMATGMAIEDRQDAGDSIAYVFPPGLDEAELIQRFYAAFRTALSEINSELQPERRLRLRVGMDRGVARRAAAGWSGQAVIEAHRIRDCIQTREMLTQSPAADFVLAVSQSVYRDVATDSDGPLSTRSFVSLSADAPEKNFTGLAWIHVPA
jgi:hypothetical protein